MIKSHQEYNQTWRCCWINFIRYKNTQNTQWYPIYHEHSENSTDLNVFFSSSSLQNWWNVIHTQVTMESYDLVLRNKKPLRLFSEPKLLSRFRGYIFYPFLWLCAAYGILVHYNQRTDCMINSINCKGCDLHAKWLFFIAQVRIKIFSALW